MTLEQVVATKLTDREAEARGITKQEYFELEVGSQIPETTQEEAMAFYEQNKNRIKDLQGKSFEEMEPAIKNNLRRFKAAEIQQQVLESLKEKAGFRLVLDAPRVEVPIPAGEPEKGAGPGAPVTIVEFSDYECGYCKRAYPDMIQLMEEYSDKVRLVYRDYPLNFHAKARPAAVAARCAGDQGKYWEYSDDLMRVAGSMDRTDLISRGEKVGLDMTAFNACLDSGKHDEAIETALEDGAALGVTGTPTMFVNGRMIVGVQSYPKLKALVEEELSRQEPTPAS
jgi:protein-disulfide isomerase